MNSKIVQEQHQEAINNLKVDIEGKKADISK